MLNLFKITNDRRKQFLEILNLIFQESLEIINHLHEDEKIENDIYESIRISTLVSIYQSVSVVGMTMTVAARNANAILRSGCRFMIIEEAGEITEGQLLSILPSTLEHLVMTGDFNQLRPNVEFALSQEPYRIDVSTLERSCKISGIDNCNFLFRLNTQHRMHPNIASIVKSVFCPKLQNADLTLKIPLPSVIPFNVRFYLHDFRETPGNGRSHDNIQEADFISNLVYKLVANGYEPNEITILPFYKGQMIKIKDKIDEKFQVLKRKFPYFHPLNGKTPHDIRVQCIDGFQGEENKVIILSLTRSEKLGFSKFPNRILVSISRAKQLMIVLANRKLFNDENYAPLWYKVFDTAKKT